MLTLSIPPRLFTAPTLPQSQLSVALELYYVPYVYQITRFLEQRSHPSLIDGVRMSTDANLAARRSLPLFSHTYLSWTDGPIDAHSHYFGWPALVHIGTFDLWIKVWRPIVWGWVGLCPPMRVLAFTFTLADSSSHNYSYSQFSTFFFLSAT